MLILRFHDDILEAPPTSALPFGDGADEQTFVDTRECATLSLYPTGPMPSILTNQDFSIREVCRQCRQLTGLCASSSEGKVTLNRRHSSGTLSNRISSEYF